MQGEMAKIAQVAQEPPSLKQVIVPAYIYCPALSGFLLSQIPINEKT